MFKTLLKTGSLTLLVLASAASLSAAEERACSEKASCSSERVVIRSALADTKPTAGSVDTAKAGRNRDASQDADARDELLSPWRPLAEY